MVEISCYIHIPSDWPVVNTLYHHKLVHVQVYPGLMSLLHLLQTVQLYTFSMILNQTGLKCRMMTGVKNKTLVQPFVIIFHTTLILATLSVHPVEHLVSILQNNWMFLPHPLHHLRHVSFKPARIVYISHNPLPSFLSTIEPCIECYMQSFLNSIPHLSFPIIVS